MKHADFPAGYRNGRMPESGWRIVVMVTGLIAVIACFILLVGGGIFWFVFRVTQPLAEAGDAFMTRLQAGEYRAAYEMMSPALQADIGSAEDLQGILNTAGGRPESWQWNSRRISNRTGYLEGNVTFAGGTRGRVWLTCLQEEGVWRVEDFSFSAGEP